MKGMMDLKSFWALIERVRGGADTDLDVRIERLEAELRALSADEVLAYSARFDEQLHRGYTWDLWGAAYTIMGGCSDDGFWDFRSALIAAGREVFEAALADPDTLADLSDAEIDNLHGEGFQYPDGQIYEEKTGKELPPPKHGGVPLEDPRGKRWENDDELEGRYPRLHARFW